jgi:hypothetical protein
MLYCECVEFNGIFKDEEDVKSVPSVNYRWICRECKECDERGKIRFSMFG